MASNEDILKKPHTFKNGAYAPVDHSHQAFPSYRFHKTKKSVVVQSEAESDALGREWFSSQKAANEFAPVDDVVEDVAEEAVDDVVEDVAEEAEGSKNARPRRRR